MFDLNHGIRPIFAILGAFLQLICVDLALAHGRDLPEHLVKCQNYLLRAPVKKQCGPTCTLYSVADLFSSHAQKPVSIEYLMLAKLRADFETVLKKGLSEFEIIPIELRSGRADFVMNYAYFLSLVSSEGILFDDEFNKFQLKTDSLYRQDGKPKIDDLRYWSRVHLFKLYELVDMAKAGKRAEAEAELEALKPVLQQLVDYHEQFKEQAMSNWLNIFSKYTYTLLVLAEQAPQDAVDKIQSEIEKWKALEKTVLDLKLQRLSRQQFVQTIISQTQMGYPVAGGFVVHNPSGHAVVIRKIHAQYGGQAELVIRDPNFTAPTKITFLDIAQNFEQLLIMNLKK